MAEPVAMKLPPQMFPLDLDNAPRVTLAGREWPIPVLAVAQLRIVTPGLLKLAPLLRRLQKAADESGEALARYRDAIAAGEAAPSGTIDALLGVMERVAVTTDEFDIMCDVIHAALTRAHPGFSRAEFNGMPATAQELIEAVHVVAAQSRGMQREPARTPGES